MKKLKDILNNIQPVKIIGETDIPVLSLQLDSRKAGKGDVFFAIRGTNADGHSFISKVTEQGAAVIVCEDLPAVSDPYTTYIQVKDARKASAIMACNFFDHPSEKLQLVGVTGTNGKTSIATSVSYTHL